MKILDSLPLLNQTARAETWFDGIQRTAARMGFARVLFGLALEPSVNPDKTFIVSNYSAAWRDRYDRQAYAGIDPTVRHARQWVEPIVWSDEIHQGRAERSFREEAVAHGVTFPLHGPRGEVGTFSFSMDANDGRDAERHIRSRLGELLIVKETVFQSALSRLFRDHARRAVVLTDREKEMLKWCAIGKTAWEISRICRCSEATVNFHLSNIRRKFGVASSRAAAVQAIALRMISV